MVVRKLLLLVVTTTLLFIVACSNDEAGPKDVELDKEKLKNVNETGMPIVEDPITIKLFTGKSAQNVNSDWNDIMIWNKYEEMTNINLEWEGVQTESLEEKRNLALASGTLPDVFYLAQLPNLDIFKYGQQGTIIKLNDLIDKYAPNLKKLMEENPAIRKAITFPDGNIYSLPSIVSQDFLSVRLSSRPWINQEWLDALGMDMPKTTEEFYQYLKAVKEQDPNGNGKADEIPYGGTSMTELIGYLEGSFGLANKGVRNGNIDLDPDNGKVRFFATTDEYREMLQYVNKLYTEGLIQKNIFTIEWGQYLANASKGIYGSTVFYDPVELLGKDVGEAYESGVALKGPNGDQSFIKVAPAVASIGNFAITDQNENPAATIRWMDYFYSDEGARLYYMGIEGETYQKTEDGKFEYTDKITNSKEGLTKEQEIAKYLAWLGGIQGIIKKEYFQGSESSPGSLEATKKLKPYVPEEIWPGFTYTEEESKVLSSSGADIDKYVEEMRDKFISGDVPFSEWDKYVKTIEDMGLEEYMEIKQAAYERYESN